MFDRFDDVAREAVVYAQEEVRLRGHHQLGAEHLLLGVLRTSEDLAHAVLQVSLEQVRDRLLGTGPPGKGSSSGHIPFTANAKRAMELALRTSLELGQGRVTTAHLLAGMLKVDDPLVSGALVGLGVDPAQAYLRARTWATGDQPGVVREPEEAAEPVRGSRSGADLQQQRGDSAGAPAVGMLGGVTSSHADTAKSLLLDGFGRVLDGVPAVVDGLTNDELLWRPDRDGNSVAWLLWHLARQADLQIADLAETEPVWKEQGWAERFALPYDRKSIGYGMSSAEVGAFTIADPSLFAGYQTEVHDRTVTFLDSLTDDDYDTVIDDRWDPPVTIAIRIVSVLDDAIKHLGQAEYVKGLLERRRAS